MSALDDQIIRDLQQIVGQKPEFFLFVLETRGFRMPMIFLALMLLRYRKFCTLAYAKNRFYLLALNPWSNEAFTQEGMGSFEVSEIEEAKLSHLGRLYLFRIALKDGREMVFMPMESIPGKKPQSYKEAIEKMRKALNV
ncbi:hypothetical protein IPG41_03870 [Candidatus Peregrinibacteria bacterium]|nr:MAG: hypothetical protein IPG41_03870 [Candidatus Peregrinibacteria bacterium]